MLAGAEPLDGFDHVLDVFGGRNDALGSLQPQDGAVFQKCGCVDGSVLFQAFVLSYRVANDLVIDIRDIHHMIEDKSVGAQALPEDVDESKCPKITNMREVIYSRPAGVHANGFAV